MGLNNPEDVRRNAFRKVGSYKSGRILRRAQRERLSESTPAGYTPRVRAKTSELGLCALMGFMYPNEEKLVKREGMREGRRGGRGKEGGQGVSNSL